MAEAVPNEQAKVDVDGKPTTVESSTIASNSVVAGKDSPHTDLGPQEIAKEKIDAHPSEGDAVPGAEASMHHVDTDQQPVTSASAATTGQTRVGKGHRLRYSFHFHCPKFEGNVCESGYISATNGHGRRRVARSKGARHDNESSRSTDADNLPPKDLSSDSADDDTEGSSSSGTASPPPESVDVGPGAPQRDRTAEYRKMLRDLDDDSNDGRAGTEPSPPECEVFVKYQNVYFDLEDRHEVLYAQTDYSPIASADIDLDQSKAIFDVVAHFRSAIHVPRWSTYRSSGSRMLPYIPPVYGQPQYHIIIRSRTIIRALQEVVTYYPNFTLSGPSVKIKEPFEVIAHHYDALRKYCEVQGRQGTDVADEETTRVSEHLGRLLAFADEHVMPRVHEEMECRSRGFVTWDMLWSLLKPGSDVTVLRTSSTQKSGLVNRDGAVVESVAYREPSSAYRESYGDATSELIIRFWYLRFDGYKLGRCSRRIDIDRFDGQMEISRLSVLPLAYSPPLASGMNLQQHLETQGRLYISVLKPSNFHHSGDIMEYPFHRMEGQVMVDVTVHLDEQPDDRPLLMAEDGTEGDGKFSRYDNIIPEETGDLDDHMYFLCPQVVHCYMFKIRSWQLVDVSNLSPPQFKPDMINTLVMDAKRINLLKSLSKSFMRQDMEDESQHSEPWSADYVKGKGNSQIFLLHGRPGVGKTYTAECISEYARRPLMTLSTSDIGTTPSEVEANLQHHFKRAKSWGAILLIDEADIYLERRSVKDLTRNGLVAGFLRALEYYEGILFLTTNRVGAFDDAFVSRIHVKLHYPALTDADRQSIWENFIKKLETERGDKMRVMRETRKYIKGDEIMDLKLNGREIRNIFQTAVGLAEFECDKDETNKIMMKEDHIAQVAEMSGEFKEYLDATLDGDEDQRARLSYVRNDEMPSPTPKDQGQGTVR